jgi:hypothetical protein
MHPAKSWSGSLARIWGWVVVTGIALVMLGCTGSQSPNTAPGVVNVPDGERFNSAADPAVAYTGLRISSDGNQYRTVDGSTWVDPVPWVTPLSKANLYEVQYIPAGGGSPDSGPAAYAWTDLVGDATWTFSQTGVGVGNATLSLTIRLKSDGSVAGVGSVDLVAEVT